MVKLAITKIIAGNPLKIMLDDKLLTFDDILICLESY